MRKIILFAGPCVIESPEIVTEVAKRLEKIAKHPQIDFYFKSSFDKANRTSLDSFRGPGLEKGLQILADIKSKFGYKIITDIHESYQAEIAAQVVDTLQIPAFLCRQTDLLVAAAKTKAIINIKKGQFLNPSDMKYSVAKVAQTRGYDYKTNDESFFACSDIGELSFKDLKDEDFSKAHQMAREAGVLAVERGTSLGYGNLVVDMRSLKIMRNFAPVIFDATHSVQMPGAAGGKSGGDSSFVLPLARAAAGVGVDGFFFETHFNPCEALCDGPNMVATSKLEEKINLLLKILNKE
ncbi:3-deoxy-8-phosphooctulonate synthase [Campylobacter sp. RM12642]|uniref:3-deoxy-8-phosphooctulonate synthase n=1 Tax=unclassified Campylobacter TaxID=2593542 RepID=UPI001BDB1AB8|nr:MULTISPECIES: 3-deoxy-8-phosphooctulonate synthase [unclassified Campylobacter]MBZ7976834.1 3-deoxy-8-phosphooctulonate synthase [Campylobacter sp. RM12637]MBZ7978602.1 3-deoxy-8-phosphooctulonate synthase [Campylobacter sp. RM12654]MBZ7980299.1 3-deoxy-8-phosphooctulonate synthase [Campylobacter sp. RM12642]MBZ7984268.1 3-deoxy-8-phosphooctulonate synthase [Campylobacter sp. RM12647]MBZ7993637.1 3-deoxy-8-phosphooctulonate synthase [Campylobacter sp. RM9333]MBZ8008128.1 3-deoxy-8-phosphoo